MGAIADGVGDHRGMIAVLDGIDRRGPDTAARRASRHDDGVDPASPEIGVEIGAEEGRRLLLFDHGLAREREDTRVHLDHPGALLENLERRHLADPHTGVTQVGAIGDRGVYNGKAGTAKCLQQLACLLDLMAQRTAEGRRRVGEPVDEIDDQ